MSALVLPVLQETRAPAVPQRGVACPVPSALQMLRADCSSAYPRCGLHGGGVFLRERYMGWWDEQGPHWSLTVQRNPRRRAPFDDEVGEPPLETGLDFVGSSAECLLGCSGARRRLVRRVKHDRQAWTFRRRASRHRPSWSRSLPLSVSGDSHISTPGAVPIVRRVRVRRSPDSQWRSRPNRTAGPGRPSDGPERADERLHADNDQARCRVCQLMREHVLELTHPGIGSPDDDRGAPRRAGATEVGPVSCYARDQLLRRGRMPIACRRSTHITR